MIDSKEEWKYQDELEELKTKISKQISQLRTEQLEALMEEMKDLFKKQWGQKLEKMLDNPKNDMWPKVREIYSQSKEAAHQELLDRLKDFDSSEKETETKVKELKAVGFKLLKSKFQEKAKQLHFAMLKK